MESTKERSRQSSVLTDRTIDDLIDERIIAEEEGFRQYSTFSTRLRAARLFAFCAASLAFAWQLCPKSASPGISVEGVRIGVAHSRHNESNASVPMNTSYTGFSSQKSSNVLKFNDSIVEISDVSSSVKDEVVSEQIGNYKRKKGLIVSVHTDGQAGAFLCNYMRHVGKVPANSHCIHETNNWNNNKTAEVAVLLRSRFHMISWGAGAGSMKSVNWEDPNLVSIFIMQDPSSWKDGAELLAANGSAVDHLTVAKCERRKNETDPCYIEARNALKRFTFVLDQNCLSESVAALAKELELPAPSFDVDHRDQRRKERVKNTKRAGLSSQRLQSSIKLYEWSKKISLVKC